MQLHRTAPAEDLRPNEIIIGIWGPGDGGTILGVSPSTERSRYTDITIACTNGDEIVLMSPSEALYEVLGVVHV